MPNLGKKFTLLFLTQILCFWLSSLGLWTILMLLLCIQCEVMVSWCTPERLSTAWTWTSWSQKPKILSGSCTWMTGHEQLSHGLQPPRMLCQVDGSEAHLNDFSLLELNGTFSVEYTLHLEEWSMFGKNQCYAVSVTFSLFAVFKFSIFLMIYFFYHWSQQYYSNGREKECQILMYTF